MESKFNGGLLGLIGISILQGIVVAITLGLGTPWAVCMKERWIAKHTIIDGHQVVFDGKGGQLFGQWIKWFVLMIITCGIYSFWVAPRMYNWVASHLHKVDDK